MARKTEFFRKAPEKPPPPSGHEMHFRCIECSEPACYGEGVSLLRGIEGTWYCSDCVPPDYLPSQRSKTGELS